MKTTFQVTVDAARRSQYALRTATLLEAMAKALRAEAWDGAPMAASISIGDDTITAKYPDMPRPGTVKVEVLHDRARQEG